MKNGSSTFVMGNNCPIMESAAYTWQRGAVQAGGGLRNAWHKTLGIGLMQPGAFAFIHELQACVGRWQH